MRKLRVAHVITRLCKGGAQENTFHTVRLADRSRFEVDLISGPTGGSEGSIEEKVREAGIEVIREPDLVRAISPRQDWRAYRNLTALFRERRYDIVHTHTSKAGFVGRLAAARTQVPIVAHTPHGHVFHSYFSNPVTRVFVWCERYAARKTDRLIALTERGIEDHLSQGVGTPGQWDHVFSGIDLAPFDAAIRRRAAIRQELGYSPGDFVVGGVGRLEPVKGFTYLVKAARNILESLPHAHILLAGDGALADALRGEASGFGERFRFLGLREDVPELMTALDVFVLPSVNEGMGRVLLESGAAGVPAVATAVGGVPDIVQDEVTGVLVPPRDPKAIARAVVSFSRDPGRRARMGEAARAMVVPAYGLEKMVERIEALYEALIEEKTLDV
jgi:glycosyltransferase involved in cell wall biosynthesis